MNIALYLFLKTIKNSTEFVSFQWKFYKNCLYHRYKSLCAITHLPSQWCWLCGHFSYKLIPWGGPPSLVSYPSSSMSTKGSTKEDESHTSCSAISPTSSSCSSLHIAVWYTSPSHRPFQEMQPLHLLAAFYDHGYEPPPWLPLLHRETCLHQQKYSCHPGNQCNLPTWQTQAPAVIEKMTEGPSVARFDIP